MTLSELKKLCRIENSKNESERILRNIEGGVVEFVLGTIINRKEDQSLLDAINHAVAEKQEHSDSLKDFWFNVWPHGIPTDRVYPSFLAVSQGSHQLNPCFSEVKLQCSRMSMRLSKKDEKTVIVLTDNWSSEIFSNYEDDFVHYACKDNIRFIFLLVNDYGFCQIPFLPEKLIKTIDEDIETESNASILRSLREGGMHYIFEGRGWNNTTVKYALDIENMIWNKYKDGNKESDGKITSYALAALINPIKWIYNQADDYDYSNSTYLDMNLYKLEVFGKTVQWNSADCSEHGDKKYMKLRKAIDAFINDCEKHKNE